MDSQANKCTRAADRIPFPHTAGFDAEVTEFASKRNFEASDHVDVFPFGDNFFVERYTFAFPGQAESRQFAAGFHFRAADGHTESGFVPSFDEFAKEFFKDRDFAFTR